MHNPTPSTGAKRPHASGIFRRIAFFYSEVLSSCMTLVVVRSALRVCIEYKPDVFAVLRTRREAWRKRSNIFRVEREVNVHFRMSKLFSAITVATETRSYRCGAPLGPPHPPGTRAQIGRSAGPRTSAPHRSSARRPMFLTLFSNFG